MTAQHPHTPSPAEIKAAREAAGLSTKEAAKLLHRTPRSWQLFESGDRKMEPALWELFSIKRLAKSENLAKNASAG